MKAAIAEGLFACSCGRCLWPGEEQPAVVATCVWLTLGYTACRSTT